MQNRYIFRYFTSLSCWQWWWKNAESIAQVGANLCDATSHFFAAMSAYGKPYFDRFRTVVDSLLRTTFDRLFRTAVGDTSVPQNGNPEHFPSPAQPLQLDTEDPFFESCGRIPAVNNFLCDAESSGNQVERVYTPSTELIVM